MRMIATEDRLDMGVAARVRSFQLIGASWDALVFLFLRADAARNLRDAVPER